MCIRDSHCPLMEPAAAEMDKAFETTMPHPPRLPVFANVTAKPVADPEEIRKLLVAQVMGRVRWRESMGAMADVGVTHFVELGGKVLAPMIKRSTTDTDVVSVVTMEDCEALARTL